MPVTTKEHESFADQLSRLRTMAEDDGETWDLSENDQAALRAVTESHDTLLALVNEASEIMTITYAGNFPAGIESFLVRAAKAQGRTGHD